ncbi:uncharacterized protein si:dkeyp-80c12.8 [Pristis pectinata]|uniref:uncharacterized protein si:dkeyp-80c12.8 n=1 Tax=Pristis pectinata TaxID=685728 RepID=UPI00223E0BD8|nr:uncharacterized protein si:dkeyp-80c12.8 [Pristis pectinata]
MNMPHILVFVAAAVYWAQALECNHCECLGKGKQCTDSVVTCDSNHTQCIVVYYERRPSIRYVRNCARTLECDIIDKTENETRFQHECCDTDRCN